MSSESKFPEPADPGLLPYVEAYLEKLENPHVVFFICRNKNRNIVVYEAKMDAGVLKPDDPLDGYWLDIDPEYQAKARTAGRADDRVDLNFFERKMAYGCVLRECEGHWARRMRGCITRALIDSTPRTCILLCTCVARCVCVCVCARVHSFSTKRAGSGSEHALQLKALPSRDIVLKVVDGKPRAETTIAGKRAYMTKVYAHARETWTGPSVEHVHVYGVDADTGAPIAETVYP